MARGRRVRCPRLDGKVQVDHVLGAAQLPAGEPFNLTQAVSDAVGMEVHLPGAFGPRPAAELNKVMLEEFYKEFIKDIPTIVVIKALLIFA